MSGCFPYLPPWDPSDPLGPPGWSLACLVTPAGSAQSTGQRGGRLHRPTPTRHPWSGTYIGSVQAQGAKHATHARPVTLRQAQADWVIS